MDMHLPATLSDCVYIDLEVNQEETIHRIGLVSTLLEIDSAEIEAQREELELLHQSGLTICGHNFRRFDYKYLLERFPDFKPWLTIDTLELSVIALPLEHSHKLNKEYKLSDYAGNNPLEDARATKKLLKDKILPAFVSQPQELRNFYAYLLSCGEDEASQAYRQTYRELFSIDDLVRPELRALPPKAIAELDTDYLQAFIAQASTTEFDQRLCVSGIVAWNYASNLSTRLPLSPWLSRLLGCLTILRQLKPVKSPREFTYQPYLQEFGISEFRGKQEEAVQSILAGENPLILMATGGGKSLCYQLPALMLSQRQKGFTVVISPLQALMTDQVQDLEQKGLDFATFINGNILPVERGDRLNQLREGDKDLLYISPEQLRSPSIRSLLEERLPSLIIFDEAHCISQWGHDFRPDYRYAPKFIGELYQQHQDLPLPLPLMAFMTATATLKVRKDIKKLFEEYKLPIHREICSSSRRENLTYQIISTSKQSKDEALVAKVQQAKAMGGAVLIYTTTRKNTERLARLLNQHDLNARFYHSKIPKEDKSSILNDFRTGDLNVVVATCAFGMGINRPDVRAVIHHTMSGNLESYVQEAGRAGRDHKPATCTLLFDPDDADTLFFLQSLNQLSELELRNLFLALRKIRKEIYGKASEDYFWVSANEIFQLSDLDEDFAREDEQRDTKIKVALHYLEIFGMIERAENQSAFIRFDLTHPTPGESLGIFDLYAHQHNLPAYRKEAFHKLILAMHYAKAYCQAQDEPYPLETLSTRAGLPTKELKQHIRELKRADVCTSKIPTVIRITKNQNRSGLDARKLHETHQKREAKICEEIIDILDGRQEMQIHCRALATRIDPEGTDKLSSGIILEILEGWKFLGWMNYKKIRHDVIKITEFSVPDDFDNYHNFIRIIIELFHKALGDQTGRNLRIEHDLADVLIQVNQKTNPQIWTLEELEKSLSWMHRHKLIRLADGSNLFHQLMKVKVIKGSNYTTVTSKYPKIVQPHYDEQTRRTHIMLDYGEHHKQPFNPQIYIEDYFSMAESAFSEQYPYTANDAAKRPVTQADYDLIMAPLNPIQQEIVLADAPSLAVIAGPGSGKTRTIVHRIAYLVKVKRVEPRRIIALAYNRNAVRELRLRLQSLIGELAARLRVYTFHGLALSILGRTMEPTRQPSQNSQQRDQDLSDRFTKLIENACDFLEEREEDVEAVEAEDQQVKVAALLGNCEYIFVDEYQDVSQQEYRLVKLIAGLQASADNAQTVQTQICVIGDDDQNIYEWRGTSTEYIRSFQAEYKAKQFLLTENYRSTEAIIEAANHLICRNGDRLKLEATEQVRIDNERVGQRGLEVQSLRFESANHQAEYIRRQVEKWITQDGIKPSEIAILARNWQYMDKARALLEKRAEIPTYSLKSEDIKLMRNYLTQKLLVELEQNPNVILSQEESVQAWFKKIFQKFRQKQTGSTVKTLLKIAEDIDAERGYGSENLATPISVNEIITSLYEFNESPEVSLDPEAVLVTSCHGAKGLEFKYVILIADGFDNRRDRVESERRLFYVAMTRAKEKLLLTHSQDSQFVQETGARPYPVEMISIQPLQFVFYADLTPKDVNLGFEGTKDRQSTITQLQEGDSLKLIATRNRNNWTIRSGNQVIGLLSNQAVENLRQRGIRPGEFTFQPGEVTVKSIFRYLDINEISGEVLDSWYVVIPQIRICR